jgi:hypothetical protein
VQACGDHSVTADLGNAIQPTGRCATAEQRADSPVLPSSEAARHISGALLSSRLALAFDRNPDCEKFLAYLNSTDPLKPAPDLL